jgi:Kef-type K+ transport system membrane component KefB
MTTTELFLVAMLIVFSAPYLLWRLARTDYYAPLVVVQIIGGVLLGPGVLGAVLPEFHRTVFNPQVIGALNGIAWWAVMIFVFVAGIELDLGEAWSRRRETVITASCALFAPLLAGCVAAGILLSWGSGWAGANGAQWQVVLAIGMACAVTALPILVLLLEKLAILRHPLGQRILRYASLDDIAIWGVLAVILLDWERMGRQLGFLLVYPVAAVGMRMLMRRLAEADRWYVGLIWLAACGLAADWAGLHFMVGAFLAGAIIDARWSTGGAAVIGGAVILLIASVGGKLAGVHLAGRLLRWPKGDASLVGWLLQTKALIMIIFANIMLDREIISAETFTALLLMAVMSTMLTIPIVSPRLRRMGIMPQND